jgi:hypothetical protein
MALLDIGPQNASLDNDYGSTKGPNAAVSHLFALYAGDPATGVGVELDIAGGYDRVAMPNDGTSWPTAAADGAKTAAAVQLPTSTGPWTVGGSPAVATHFVLLAPDGVTRWDSGRLDTPISVDAAGADIQATPTVYYDPTI